MRRGSSVVEESMGDGSQRSVLKEVGASVPLVVDLDGTLIHSDVLFEAIAVLLASKPFTLVSLLMNWRRGKAWIKSFLSGQVSIDVEVLPYNQSVIDFIVSERKNGRSVYIASASSRAVVENISSYLGLFDGVFATEGEINLRGRAKAEVLCKVFGTGGFDYIGDSSVDFPVWDEARRVLVVTNSSSLEDRVLKKYENSVAIGCRSAGISEYMRQFRVYQWVKSLILFIPILSAHSFYISSIAGVVLAALSFCFFSSSAYVLNDILDIQADRRHPSKKRRPLASGVIPMWKGMVAVPVFVVAGIVCGRMVSTSLLIMALSYLFASLIYSFYLKRIPIVDVTTLAGLYTLRILSGGVAADAPASSWLLAFSIFFFLCLALVKRYSELMRYVVLGKSAPERRGYRLEDASLIQMMGVASGFAAVVMLTLYISSPAVLSLYGHPEGLWGVCILLFIWLSRVLLIAHRGEMNDDPVLFALRDKMSLACVLLIGVIAYGSYW